MRAGLWPTDFLVLTVCKAAFSYTERVVALLLVTEAVTSSTDGLLGNNNRVLSFQDVSPVPRMAAGTQ